jgi:divalent metal cation (Fe/Co/Zn/Cd) transporter
MDISLPTAQLEQIENCLNSYAPHEITYHALRTRQAGSRSFISLHVLVPGHWSVQKSHDWAEKIEADLRSLIPYTHVTTHIEPREDQRAMDDQELDL